MTDLTVLPPAKLRALLVARSAAVKEAQDAMIRAGYGHMRQSEIYEAAKGSSLLARTALCRAYVAARDPERDAYAEQVRRYDFHGCDKRTPAVA